jgi:predicted Ser/Thr protein kinase
MVANMKKVKSTGLLLICLSPLSIFADDEMRHPLPDDSYIHAKLSRNYTQCIKQSDAVTFEMQKCMDQEYDQQEKRVQEAVARIISRPDSIQKDKYMDEIAAWWDNTARYCQWDPKTEGQGQMLDAQSCSLNRVANLADKISKY